MPLARRLSQLSPRALAMVVFGTVSIGLGVVMSYLYHSAVAQRDAAIRHHVEDLAVTAAALVDVERHERLTAPDQFGGADYRAVLEPLVRFHLRHPNVQYLWTVRFPTADEGEFVLETSTDARVREVEQRLGRQQDVIPYLSRHRDSPNDLASLPTLRAGRTFIFPGLLEDGHGSSVVARAPLVGPKGEFVGYVGLHYAADSYLRELREVQLVGALTLLLGLLLALFLARANYLMRTETLRNFAEADLQRERAEKATAAKGQLLAIATHDLKNPLSAIAGLSDLLLQSMQARPSPAADDVRALETIRASARHMSEIVRGVLLNEGLEHGGLTADIAPVDLAAIAHDVVRFSATAAGRKQIAVQVTAPSRAPAAGDRKLLREAFDNYLSNAIKYSPPGRKVTVAVEPDPARAGSWTFSVRDQGPGLDAADQAKLFQKFTKLTPRPTGGESSTGVGLSIVKVIAELHRAEVGCDTALGAGCRFWFRLPAPVRP